MSLTRGSFGLKVYDFTGPAVAEDIYNKLVQLRFREGASTDVMVQGTCDITDNETAPQESNTVLADKWVVFTVRRETKRVPRSVLVSELRKAIQLLPQGTKVNRNEMKERLMEQLLPNFPFVPAYHAVAFDLEQKLMFCEGPVFDWLVAHMGTMGLRFNPLVFVPSSDSMKKLRDNKANNITLSKDRPEEAPETLAVIVTPQLLGLSMDEKKITFRGNGMSGEEESESLIEAGAEIVQVSATLNLEHSNFDLKLAAESNQLKSNFPIKVKGTIHEKLQIRLTVLRALAYCLNKASKVVA